MGGGGTMLNGAGIDLAGNNNNGEMTECQCSGNCNNPLMNSQTQQFGGNGCNQQQCSSNFANAADAINCQQQQPLLGGGQSNGCSNNVCPQSTNGACMGDGNNNNNFFSMPNFGGGRYNNRRIFLKGYIFKKRVNHKNGIMVDNEIF